MKKSSRKRSVEQVLIGDISHSPEQMPIGGNFMKKKNLSLSANNTVSRDDNHSPEQTSKGKVIMKNSRIHPSNNVLPSGLGFSFTPLFVREENNKNPLPFANAERKTATLEFELEQKPTNDVLEKIRINATLIVMDWRSYKPTVRVTSIGKIVLVEIEGHLPKDSREFLPHWESMISDVVVEAISEGAKNGIAYETFSKSFVKPKIFMNSLKQIIAGIYNIDTNSITASYRLVVDDEMTVYHFEFSENTVKNHEKNLAKLRAADEAMMIRLEREALVA